jgi:predicted kinase
VSTKEVPAKLYVMVGLPASGKTKRAREIEQDAGALRLTPDEWMFPLLGVKASRRLPTTLVLIRRARAVMVRTMRAKAIRPLLEDDSRRDVIEGRFIWLARRALSLGISVILDFGFWSRAERSALRSLAIEEGARYELIYMEIDEKTQRAHRDLRESVDANLSVPLSDVLLDAYTSQFEAPDEDELTGVACDPAPQGFATWADWIAERWPTALED